MGVKLLPYILLILGYSSCTLAQSNNTIGFLPKITLSNEIHQKIKLVNSLESRQSFYNDHLNPENQYQYILTDITNILSFRAGNGIKLNLGYLFRIREGEVFHRSIQQLTFITTSEGIRLAHRIATDQTFNANRLPLFRLRYRITLEKPLNGLRVDNREFYLKINNEYLGSLMGSKSDVEIRVVPFVGYELNKKNKVEIGMDYRIDDFINSKGSDHAIWLAVNWYISI